MAPCAGFSLDDCTVCAHMCLIYNGAPRIEIVFVSGVSHLSVGNLAIMNLWWCCNSMISTVLYLS